MLSRSELATAATQELAIQRPNSQILIPYHTPVIVSLPRHAQRASQQIICQWPYCLQHSKTCFKTWYRNWKKWYTKYSFKLSKTYHISYRWVRVCVCVVILQCCQQLHYILPKSRMSGHWKGIKVLHRNLLPSRYLVSSLRFKLSTIWVQVYSVTAMLIHSVSHHHVNLLRPSRRHCNVNTLCKR
jgi:hypothetical protein